MFFIIVSFIRFQGINFGILEGVEEDGRHWKFEGQIFDEQPEGGGQMTWDNGDSYEGDFHVGLRHGNGVFNFKNGTIYKGKLRFVLKRKIINDRSAVF